MTNVISPDGFAVVHITPDPFTTAPAFSQSLSSFGYTGVQLTGGVLNVNTASYVAGWKGGNLGGAGFKATFSVASLKPGQRLDWIQIGNDNSPIAGFGPSPWFDNGNYSGNLTASSQPFYSYTSTWQPAGQAATQSTFGDFASRNESLLTGSTPITWSASLYPVILDGTNILVGDGVTWGWEMQKAMVGTDSAKFINPVGGTNNVGVGTSKFSWGIPDPDASWVSFTPLKFDPTRDPSGNGSQPFKIGTITFHNGNISSRSGATGITFNDSMMFDNVPEKNFDFSTTFTLINTPNVTGDPHKDADKVVLGNFGFTFTVDEGAEATATILAKLSTNLKVPPGGLSANGAYSPLPFIPSPDYTLSIVGLTDIQVGGSVEIDPSSFAIAATVESDGVAAPSGTTEFTFVVTRAGDSSQAATLNYSVAGTGANPVPDALFANPTGTVSFAAGDTSEFLAVDVNGASVTSPETFTATLSAPPAGTTITTASANGTIETNNFFVDNRTTLDPPIFVAGDPYTGPVAGLKYQLIDTTTDSLNITPSLANTFIHSGGGFDAIDVSGVSGTNVLDGGTNSNFLVGGTAAGSFDTFFVDDRGPASDIWSTVANFHAGDAATVFGITQTGFNTSWVDGQGAAGFTGLTLHVTAPGVPTASLTLSGYSTADLTNGRLTTSFGTETDGTPYLYVHANT